MTYGKLSLIILAVAFVIIVIAAWSGLRDPIIQRRSNLHLINLALNQYESHHKIFPPEVERDESGRALHSWRTLIAQYMSVTKIPYDFNFSWDSSENHYAIEAMPLEFSSQLSEAQKGRTNYIAVTGFGTVWKDGVEFTERDFLSLPSNAIVAIEVPNSDIIWTEPRDMSFVDFLSWWSNARIKYSRNPPLVLLRDGSVELLSDELVAELKHLHDDMAAQNTGENRRDLQNTVSVEVGFLRWVGSRE